MTKRIILAAAAATLLLAGPALAVQTVGASGGVSATVPAVAATPARPSLGISAVAATPAVPASGSASADLTAPPADIAVTPTASDPLAPAASGKTAKAKKRAR